MSNNLSTFAEIVKKANEEKKIREAAELERKTREVAPLLSELFSTISVGKKVFKEINLKEAPLLNDLQTALANPEKFKTESRAKKEKIIELVAEIETKANKIKESPSIEKSDDANLEKKFIKLFNKLQDDFQTLKRYIDNKQSFSGGGTAGSGEVRILRMDDVIRGPMPLDGAVMTWDSTLKKFKFVLPLNSGGNVITDEEMPYAKRIDFITDDVLYKGEATVGSLESAPVWRIRKIIIGIDSDVSETWANGTSTYDKIWLNRTELTYS